jgi:hypothetical protein
MVSDVLVPIGNHRTSSIPALIADDMDFLSEEGVGITDY